MAHFAEIDANNIVLQVIVIADENATNEKAGQEFIQSIGISGTWLQTSYNTRGNEHILGGTPFRKNYAGIGYIYDSERDAFIPPKPVNFKPSGEPIEYTLNENTCLWEEIE